MSELVNTFPFPGMGADGGLDIGAIFGEISAGGDTNPFDPPPAASPLETASNTSEESAARTQPQPSQAADIVPEPTPAPAAPADEPEPAPAPVAQAPEPEPVQEAEADSNPIAAAFTQQAEKNTQQGLLEKPPVFCYKNVKEPIEDADMSFEELRIRKSDDFTELEEGKSVSWSVEYCGIRKEIRDPKGTTIRAMKESIERSREFLDALKKAKGKASGCCVRPKVTMKSKGVASYKGTFQTVEEARASDKVICLIPSGDGRLYELRKTEQGEFIAPKNRVGAYQQVRAGFIPALPLIPLSLMGQIIAFFRGFMTDGEEYEALALIYWDKDERRYFVYVPRQTVEKEGIEADLRDCPYDDNPRYIRYADIHSHNSMDAFFSSIDDMDERGTGLYLVIGHLEKFFPDVEARISCGGSFCAIDPGEVIEGLAGPAPYPAQWRENVTPQKAGCQTSQGLSRQIGGAAMRCSTTAPVKIVMLGAGGTGGHIAPLLYRLLYTLDRPSRFVICDGDIVEEKNLIRQNFSPADLGENKAKVLAERYASVFGMEAAYVPSFVEDLDTLMKLITPRGWELEEHSCRRTMEMVLLLGAVDNNRSRQLCHEAFYQSDNLIYIDSGNGEFSGQVVCGVRAKGRTIFRPVGKVYPEMLKAADKFPTEPMSIS